MSSRSDRLTALEAGLLGGGDPLYKAKVVSFKQALGSVFLGVALLVLVCAALVIGYKLGILLFAISR